MKNQISKQRLFYVLLAISLAFFFIKGIRYALIGSYVPLLFIGVVGLLFLLGKNTNSKVTRRVIRFWAICLFLWAGGVLFVEVVFQFVSITEAHIRDQFTVWQNLLIALFMFTAIYLMRNVKHVVSDSGDSR